MDRVKVPQIDYTSRDYESIVSDLIDKIPLFCEEWTDYNPSDLGIVLIELFAYIADGLHYYIDRMVNEAYLPTAISRKNVVNLLKLIDYELRSAVPATVDLTFTLGEVQTEAVLIPQGTKCSTSGEEPVYFETINDLTILPGEVEGVVGAKEGESKQEYLGVSDGKAFQNFQIKAVPIIDGSLEILINEGTGDEKWEGVDTLALVGATEKKYNVQKDDEDILTIYFGDDSQGKIPKKDASINAKFRVGGGTRGNIGGTSVSIIESTIMHKGSPLTISVLNNNPATGGVDRESIEVAKLLGPKSLRALNRAVTCDDYKYYAEKVEGVAKAVAVDKGLSRTVEMYIAPEEGGIASVELMNEVKSSLESKKVAGILLKVKSAEYVEVDLTGTVYVKPNFTAVSVKPIVEKTVSDCFAFSNPLTNFGRSIYLSDIYSLIDSLDGIDHIEFKKLTMKPKPKYEVWSGNAEFGVISISDTIKKELWTVYFVSPTTFKVTGSVSGEQINIGELDNEYLSDNGEVKFTLNSGESPMSVADRAIFRTSSMVGSVDMNPYEIPKQGDIVFDYVGGN